MNSNECQCGFFSNSDPKRISRRCFFSRAVGGAAGLSLLAIPGVTGRVSAKQSVQSKEEILKELAAKAEKFMSSYGTCSQSSFAALNEQFNLQADQAIPGLKPLAGGLAGKGETCGAVSGALLALGTFFESGNHTGSEQSVSLFQYGGAFLNGFEKAFGSTRCREVVKFQFGRYYDFLNPEDQKLFMAESEGSDKCLEVVKKAVLLAGDIMISYL